MTCEIEIKDLVAELAKPSVITPVLGLSFDETAGVLTGILKSVDQASDVISEKGLGSYGLSLQDLQKTGVVKKGLGASIDPADLAAILSDPSVFTGKHGVNNVDNILANEALQQELINEVVSKNMCDMRSQGVITGLESVSELAALAGMAAKFSISDIKGKLAGTISDLLNSAMDKLGGLAAFGAVLAVAKQADILGKLKGLGRAVVSLPELAADTIDTADIFDNVDKLIGSVRIPKASDIAAGVTDSLSVLGVAGIGATAQSLLADLSDPADVLNAVTDATKKLPLGPGDYSSC